MKPKMCILWSLKYATFEVKNVQRVNFSGDYLGLENMVYQSLLLNML